VKPRVTEAVHLTVIRQAPAVETILEAEVDVLLWVTKSVERGYLGESAVRVKPKEAARHSHGILISSGAHVVSQLIRFAYVMYSSLYSGAPIICTISAGYSYRNKSSFLRATSASTRMLSAMLQLGT
jgi:hypothetical protein